MSKFTTAKKYFKCLAKKCRATKCKDFDECVDAERSIRFFLSVAESLDRERALTTLNSIIGCHHFNPFAMDEIHALIEAIPPKESEKEPSLMDLRGIAPNCTGDLSSEDFVRKIRDAQVEAIPKED